MFAITGSGRELLTVPASAYFFPANIINQHPFKEAYAQQKSVCGLARRNGEV